MVRMQSKGTRTFDEPAPSSIPWQLLHAEREEQLPDWADSEVLAAFFHHNMKPWHDTLEDVRRAIEYGFSEAPGKGGFVVIAARSGRVDGALLMLNTGMGGYVPEHLLLFVAVRPTLRGRGLGRHLIEEATRRCTGAVKLHVEYENPARRLYEQLGFRSEYAEMRLAL